MVPIAAFTSMVHTVSGIVLHRLHRMMNTGDAPYEAREVIAEMVRLVKQWDPYFFEKVGLSPIAEADVPEAGFPLPRQGGDGFAEEFDAGSTAAGRACGDVSPEAEEIVAESVRSVFGLTAGEMTRRRGDRPGDESGAEPVSARCPQRLVSLAADAVAASRHLRVREAAESHGRLAGPASPHGAGVATADDVCRYDATRTTSRRG